LKQKAENRLIRFNEFFRQYKSGTDLISHGGQSFVWMGLEDAESYIINGQTLGVHGEYIGPPPFAMLWLLLNKYVALSAIRFRFLDHRALPY